MALLFHMVHEWQHCLVSPITMKTAMPRLSAGIHTPSQDPRCRIQYLNRQAPFDRVLGMFETPPTHSSFGTGRITPWIGGSLRFGRLLRPGAGRPWCYSCAAVTLPAGTTRPGFGFTWWRSSAWRLSFLSCKSCKPNWTLKQISSVQMYVRMLYSKVS